MSQAQYRMDESDWFAQRELPGYEEDDETEETANDDYVAQGQGDEWGVHHDFTDGTSKYESLAHDCLRSVARLLCSTTLFKAPDRGLEPLFAWLLDDEDLVEEHDPYALHSENREVELTDPELHIPRSMPDQWANVDYGQYRHRRRVNEETGYVTGGESTGVYIADSPEPVFMEAVEIFLIGQDFMERREQELRGYARSLKREGQLRDVDILEKVIYAAKHGEESEK